MEIHAKKETTDMDEVFKEIRKRKALAEKLADTLNKSAITLTHMFADNTARDSHFVAHPTISIHALV